ncbi:hypothetical protein FOA52_014681 [Chlamydomonas sp. UWO 241]|nr:hypothetical protein FOA52_014681 [Chlamydomonas sp. UWO 241]
MWARGRTRGRGALHLLGVALAVLSISVRAQVASVVDYEDEVAAGKAGEDMVWRSGSIAVLVLSKERDDDEHKYMLLGVDGDPAVELDMGAGLMGTTPPGSHVTVHGWFDGTSLDLLHVSAFYPTPNTVAQLDGEGADEGEVAAGKIDAPPQPPWIQRRVVTTAPVLVLIAEMCGKEAAASVEDVESVIFSGNGSAAKTLQAYFAECSRGQAKLDRTNSLVAGPIPIPCSFEGTVTNPFRFRTDRCLYQDSSGWHYWAQLYARDTLGINISAYSHRILLMPYGYARSQANCGWIGQGTLGPSTLLLDGSYGSSMVWLSGEYWNVPMAYMHEIGHTLYLHHSARRDGCDTCDRTCLMGACCDTRCFNAPHAWQLGWGRPLVQLNSSTLPTAGEWRTFALPAQHTADENMILITPDWNVDYNASDRQHAWFVAYRIDSGRYDDDIPPEFTFQSSVYRWDGGAQDVPVITQHWASIYDGEWFRNYTDRIVMRQGHGSPTGTTVALCRVRFQIEVDCTDGLDDDCDGLIDGDDDDCGNMDWSKIKKFSALDAALHPPSPPRPPHPPSPPLPPLPVWEEQKPVGGDRKRLLETEAATAAAASGAVHPSITATATQQQQQGRQGQQHQGQPHQGYGRPELATPLVVPLATAAGAAAAAAAAAAGTAAAAAGAGAAAAAAAGSGVGGGLLERLQAAQADARRARAAVAAEKTAAGGVLGGTGAGTTGGDVWAQQAGWSGDAGEVGAPHAVVQDGARWGSGGDGGEGLGGCSATQAERIGHLEGELRALSRALADVVGSHMHGDTAQSDGVSAGGATAGRGGSGEAAAWGRQPQGQQRTNVRWWEEERAARGAGGGRNQRRSRNWEL